MSTAATRVIAWPFLIPAVCVFTSIASGCGGAASAPTPLNPPPTRQGIVIGTSSTPVQAIEIYYRVPLGWLAIGSTFGYNVFAIHTDGVYETVGQPQGVVWTSSNPAVIEVLPTGNGTLRAVSPGTTQIVATYQGFTDRVTQSIRATIPPYPFLDISPRGAPGEEGMTATGRAVWRESDTAFTDVTGLAEWTSSNPAVATVAAGTVTARRIGTAQITASYNGATDSYTFSVYRYLGVSR